MNKNILYRAKVLGKVTAGIIFEYIIAKAAIDTGNSKKHEE